MTEELKTKVVLRQPTLHPMNDSALTQRVANVYINGSEYRVSAPGGAGGDASDWLDHFYVTQLDEWGGEVVIQGATGVLVRKLVKEKLQEDKRDSARATGVHPDGLHYTAHVCLTGHVQTCERAMPTGLHCTQCGAVCIDNCSCGELIRGGEVNRPVDQYRLPLHCHACGEPYPWMAERFQTAKDLLRHEEKLTQDDRKELFGILQYVMSNPMSDLVPAKKKLLEIKMANITPQVREFILDLMAKTTAAFFKD
jgi:hypothetical protein